MRQGEFEGWYFKQQQCGGSAVAFIPAHFCGRGGEESASLQIITPQRAVSVPVPASAFRVRRQPFSVQCGGCHFGLDGCKLDCTAAGLPLKGELRYENLAQPRWDIMGPFRFVPFMQCRHSLVSMAHRVTGRLSWGADRLDFAEGQGYIEGDRGRSFPRQYLWTHCGWDGNSVMLSIADIPFGPSRFTGCIGAVYFKGNVYRFATYLGVRLEHVDSRGAVIRQGELSMQVTLEQGDALDLQAPTRGNMERIIRESLTCRVHYQMRRGSELLFSMASDQASFESEWEESHVRTI